MTRDLETDYYHGVFELETILIIFAIEVLKRLIVIAADVSSACIQVMASELVYTISGNILDLGKAKY